MFFKGEVGVFDFRGKTALVTGGTTGIGFSTAIMLAKNGAGVAVVGRDDKKGTEALEQLTQIKKENIYIKGDVSKTADCRRIVQETSSMLGRLDILVNSAGVFMEGPIETVSETDYYRIMDINVKGTFFMCKFVLPELRKAGGGSIVNVSSDSGITGNTHAPLYCASKGAVTIFTKALAVDVARENIRVNCVCPGDIQTPMLDREAAVAENPETYRANMVRHYPAGRVGRPEEVAATICFLSSHMAPFVVGAAWSIDGGLTSFSY
ncbi:MAG: SDR family oxidoreductase [Deltaproteobacteria bacterium]|nr:SDR family oxidoreductase [Deltaproteobacteria bacterium]